MDFCELKVEVAHYQTINVIAHEKRSKQRMKHNQKVAHETTIKVFKQQSPTFAEICSVDSLLTLYNTSTSSSSLHVYITKHEPAEVDYCNRYYYSYCSIARDVLEPSP